MGTAPVTGAATDAPRVLLNLLWLVPGVVGGTEESTVALVRALAEHQRRHPGDLRLEVAVRSDLLSHHPDLARMVRVHAVAVPAGRAGRIALEHTWLAARSRDHDLVHHAGGTVPVVRGAPAVVTVHDLQPLEAHPGGPRRTHGRVKRAYLRRAVPHAVRAARAVLVPSEFVRATVTARTGVAPERVIAVPHPVVAPGAATAPGVLRSRYRLDGEAILYPVITYPHKNHLVLLDAFARVLRERPDALLVLPGGAGPAEAEVMHRVGALGVGDRVRRLGRIPAADLAGLYGLAAVVAFPSRYEGFGMGAAEALLQGVPVVAARATALTEIVGDAGLLVDPDDVGAWAQALVAVLGDGALRAAMAAAGPRRALRWAPESVSARVVQVYRAALGGSVPGDFGDGGAAH